MKNDNPPNKLHDDGAEKPAAIATGGILHHLRVSVVATIVLALICCGIYPLIVWGLSQAIFRDKANGSLVSDDKGRVIGSKLIGQSFSDARYFHPRPSAAGNGYDPTSSGGSNLGPTSAKLINGTTKPTTLPAPKPTDPAIPGPDAVDYDGIKLRIVLYCQENNIPGELAQDLPEFKGLEAKIVQAKIVKAYSDDKGSFDQVKLIKAFNHDKAPLTFKPSVALPADAVTASASGLDPHISPANAELQAKRVADARKVSVDVVKKLIEENTDRRDLGFLGEAGVNVLRLNLALDKAAPVSAPPVAAANQP